MASGFPTPRFFQIITSGQMKYTGQVQEHNLRTLTDKERLFSIEYDTGETQLFDALSETVSDGPRGATGRSTAR